MSKQHLLLLSLCASLFCSSLRAADADIDVDAFDAAPLPEVLTPVRLKQPRTEVPASVSVIDAEMIQASGIRQLPELLRLIPGMAVGARSGWDYVVSYHGTNRSNSHRMQVMIDGRSIYQAGLATIDWSDIPLAMEDIERIEVTRGPDTAAYGANAFLGVINIITRHPDDSARLRFKVTGGTNHTTDFYASTSGNTGQGSYRMTLAGQRDSGFDKNEEGLPRRDGKDLQFINGRWLLTPTATWTLDLQAGYKTGVKHDDLGEGDITPPDQYDDNYFASINSEHFLSTTNSLKWQIDYSGTRNNSTWRSCAPASDLDPSLPSSWTICGDLNQNIRNERTDLDVQDTWLSEGPWKLVSGAHAQHQYVISESYYSGSVSRSTYQLFVDAEYHFLPQWSATLAGSQEYLGDGDQSFSPRAALLFMPDDENTFRVVYSEAIRTPDLFESRLAWHYIARNLTLGNGSTIPGYSEYPLPTYYSPANTEERIRSRELGYYGLWFKRRLEIDIKAFNDDLDDLISDNPSYGNYYPVNANSVKQTGAETDINLRVNAALRLHLNAAFIDSNATQFSEESLTPHKSGAAAVLFKPAPGWEYSSFYYYAYPVNGAKFVRWDNRVARDFNIASSRLTLSATVQHYFNKHPDLFADNVYDSPNRIYVALNLSF